MRFYLLLSIVEPNRTPIYMYLFTTTIISDNYSVCYTYLFLKYLCKLILPIQEPSLTTFPELHPVQTVAELHLVQSVKLLGQSEKQQ